MTAPAPLLPTRVPRETGRAVVRLVLAVLLVVLGVSSWLTPVERPLSVLQGELAAGRVHSVQVEVPPAGTSGSGFEVRWRTGSPRRFVSQYGLPGGAPAPNEVLAAVARSPRDVQVETVGRRPLPRSGWQPRGVAGLLVVLGLLALLLQGFDPRHASRWGWFWLGVCLPVAALAFVLLEPVPLWRRDAVALRPRLTGGWALLLGLVVAGLGGAALPSLTGLFWVAG